MKNNNYISQIKHIINCINIGEEAIEIKESEKIFPFFKGNGQYTSDLQQKLSDVIYEEFYCKGTRTEVLSSNPSPSLNYQQETFDFVSELSKANTTITGFDIGWKIEEKTSEGFVSIEKNGYRRKAMAGEYIFSNTLFSTDQEERIDLCVPKEKFIPDNGFHYIFGQEREFDDNSFLVRFYFNLKAEGAAKLVHILTSKLNEKLIPFQFKCLRHPDMYTRTDSAVLYVSKMYAEMAFQVILSQRKKINNINHCGVPLFTHALLPGVGFAESPVNTSVSFGQSRADLIAKALIEFQEVNQSDKLSKVVDFIGKSALSIDEIWRNPYTNYPYSFNEPK